MDKKDKDEIDFSKYSRREDLFDHPSERVFYEFLRDHVLGANFVAMVQIPLYSLINVDGEMFETGSHGYHERVSRKRVDFVLCRRDNMQPLLVIELDGSSHQDRARKKRDKFVNQLFYNVGMPFLRIKVRETYDADIVTKMIVDKLGLKKKEGD